MYESIIAWGLKTLKTLADKKVEEEFKGNLALITEAMKTKNALMIKRFEYAWSATNALYDLSLKVDQQVRELEKKFIIQKNSKRSASEFLSLLFEDVHPPNLEQLRHIRSQFEATNEILSWYSLELCRQMMPEKLMETLKSKAPRTVAAASESYRHVWTMMSSTLQALIRITSQDLRFWLSEVPHSRTASQWAKTDVQRMLTYVLVCTPQRQRTQEYELEIEKDRAVDKFWKECKED